MTRASFVIAVAAIVISSSVAFGRPEVASRAAGAFDSADTRVKATMEDSIVAKEREGLDALKAGHPEEFGKLTADDAVFVDAAGAASKAQVMQNVGGFKLTDYSMENVKFVRLSNKSGLITYKINETGNSHGKDFTAHSYISSIWEERGGTWLCLFSQETGAR